MWPGTHSIRRRVPTDDAVSVKVVAKIIRQPAPPLPDPGKNLPAPLQRSLKRSEEQMRNLGRKLREASQHDAPTDSQ